MVNGGIGGGRVLEDGVGPNALARFDRDVLAQPGVTHVTVRFNRFNFCLLATVADATSKN